MIRVELISRSEIAANELTDRDIMWLTMGCLDSIDKVAAVDQVKSALVGRSGIYRVSGDAEGIFVLTEAGKKVVITAMAGKNFIRKFEEVHGEILAAAAACGAESVAGFVTRPGLKALYKAKTQAKFAEYFEESLG